MIWAKTDAGRAEMKARSLIKERARRNLLLLVDGKTPAERLLAHLPGLSGADLAALQAHGLIEPVSASPLPPPPASSGVDVDGLDYATLRGSIGRMISKELGLRGLAMSMILEESLTIDDLKDVAERLLRQIAERKGPEAAAAARTILFGR